MKSTDFFDQYLMVCKCKGFENIMGLFDNNRITVDDVPLTFSLLKECPRCKAQYRKVEDIEPEFGELMKFRKQSSWHRIHS